jgi:hypothetical protein
MAIFRQLRIETHLIRTILQDFERLPQHNHRGLLNLTLLHLFNAAHHVGSRRTVAGEKAGTQTATYSAPFGSGVL